uniref:Uncharacterized protein n=1 Tax=viral metagenome TaxID=1070528 RepID=A0A6M3KYD5_9ZZZZ
MKPAKISVLIGKKKTQVISKPGSFVWSWDIHYGVTATLDPGESYHDVLRTLNVEIKRLVNEAFGEETPVKLTMVASR